MTITVMNTLQYMFSATGLTCIHADSYYVFYW